MIRRMIRRERERGSLIILGIIMIFAISAIGLSLSQVVLVQYQAGRENIDVENGIFAAKAGVSASLEQLNSDINFSGYGTEQVLYSVANRGRATYTVTVTNGSNGEKIIESTGRVYKTTSGGTAINTKKVKVAAVNKKEGVTNSLIFGSGGVYLRPNAGFPKGNVYIAGQLQMKQNSYIGGAAQSATLDITNLGCGTSANWPQPCGSSNQPIKMLDATSGNIYGTVCAKDQTTPTGISAGSNPVGQLLKPNCAPRMGVVPSFNKEAFVNSVSSTNTDPSVYACPVFGGTKTIPANTRIYGNLVLSTAAGISCTVYLEGNVYVTGSITIVNARIQASDAVGTTRPILVVNGSFNVTFNASGMLSTRNAYGTPLYLVTFDSTDATCSNNENVPSETVRTCLSPAQAQASAIPSIYTGAPGSIFSIDASGIILYSYYKGIAFTPSAAMTFYAVGMQGISLGSSSTVTTVSDDAPFGDILSFSRFRIIEYQQVFN